MVEAPDRRPPPVTGVPHSIRDQLAPTATTPIARAAGRLNYGQVSSIALSAALAVPDAGAPVVAGVIAVVLLAAVTLIAALGSRR